MAPEHLDSIHTVSTEKSDVYSFAIVVWVILTEEEPYASRFGVKSCIMKETPLQTQRTPSIVLKLQQAPGRPKCFLFLCSDARSEDQICQCVRNGDRPAEDSLPEDTPPEMIHLMKWSWKSDPLQRPTFKGPIL